MANKKRKSTKVNKNLAVTIIALTAALAVLIVAVLALRNWKPGTPSQTDPVETTVTQQTTAPQETTQPAPTQPPIQLEEQVDGTFEQWTAAGMLMLLPLEYPDFADLEIYVTGETALADRMESKGVYLKFTSGGAQVILHAAPLAAERKEPGTRDMTSKQTGFATMDVVTGVDLSQYTLLTLDSLNDHIRQVTLPSMYTH